ERVGLAAVLPLQRMPPACSEPLFVERFQPPPGAHGTPRKPGAHCSPAPAGSAGSVGLSPAGGAASVPVFGSAAGTAGVPAAAVRARHAVRSASDASTISHSASTKMT